MKPETSIQSQLTTKREHYITGSVTSDDATSIGYRQLGHGPGIVLVHGAMESAQSHMQLAEALADSFTVYMPDRRGRGQSGPYSKDYSIQKDIEDMDALLTKTSANYIFGVSSGAIIALQAALTLPSVRKVAIYEPPLSINGSLSTDFVSRFEKEISQGNTAAALVTGMKGAQMGPPIFNVIPRWLLRLLTKMMMTNEDKRATDDDMTFRALAPTLHYDFRLVVEMSEKLESFRAISAEVLLLGGSKSPVYLKVALDALEKILPDSKRITFSGLGHGGSGNANQGGKPERVEQELLRFFA